jgi:UPF0271 protein
MQVDLNGDVGEWSGPPPGGHDGLLMPALTSANIACGFHAGNPTTMRLTVALARQHGVAVGAHPGFPDLEEFGRREIPCTAAEVEDMVVYQIGALAAIAAHEGVRLMHVKPHGALYNMAARDEALADAIARAVVAVDPALVLFGLSGSHLVSSARRAGLRAAAEVFADRAYRADGSLVPRSEEGAVLHDERVVIDRAVQMVTTRTVTSVDGTRVPLDVDTMCLHGDTPGAAVLAGRLRGALAAAGVDVRACAASRGR